MKQFIYLLDILLAPTLRKVAKAISVYAIAPLVLALLISAPTYAYGVSNSQECSGAAATSSFCQESGNTTDPISGQNGNGMVLKVARLVILAAGVAAIIVIILAGFTYINSSGDPAKTETAKTAIIYALVGLVVIILAQGIIGLVISKT